MAKSKALQTWTEVDDTLRVIAEHQAKIKTNEARMNAEILEIKKRYFDETTEAREAIIESGKLVTDFATKNPQDFVKPKTKKLIFGEVSYSKTSGALKTTEGVNALAVVARLKRLGMDKYIRTVEEPNLELIKAEIESAKDLASIGMYIEVNEKVSYKVYEEDVEAPETTELLPQ